MNETAKHSFQVTVTVDLSGKADAEAFSELFSKRLIEKASDVYSEATLRALIATDRMDDVAKWSCKAYLVDSHAALVEALEELEAANDALCSIRSQQTYDQMIADGNADTLSRLDAARMHARSALSLAKGETQGAEE